MTGVRLQSNVTGEEYNIKYGCGKLVALSFNQMSEVGLRKEWIMLWHNQTMQSFEIGSPTSGILILIFFILGTVIGSFLNVLVLRYNTGRSLTGRSGCFSCGKKLRWYELLPVVSYLIQGGKCRGCGSKISTQYPLVELGTGVLFALTLQEFWPLFTIDGASLYIPVLTVVFHLVVWSILMAITVYDIRHKIIPDGLVYAFIGLAFLYAALMEVDARWVGAATLMAAFFAALWFFSSGRWMGFGDAKLALGIGLFLGPSRGLAALILAFWIGALFGISLLLFRGRYATMKVEVPFAPFLILGTVLTFFAHLDMQGVLSLFSFTDVLY